LASFLDAIAPTALVGQGLGRWGNWFNQELYGGPTKLPWGLRIDKAHFSNDYLNQLQQQGKPVPDVATFHPTFLYECLWDLTGFAILIWLDRRFKIGYGRLAALYVMYYTAGRGWIENLRIDNVELHDVLGLRFNVWTSIVCFTGALVYFLWSLRRHPGKEPSVYDDQPTAAALEAPTATGE
jgi:prolipoprotein diacylglyceryl transferase